MKQRTKTSVAILLALMIGVIGYAFAACGKSNKTPAPEPITYFGEAGGVEYTLKIAGETFELDYGGTSRHGDYAESGKSVTLTFRDTEGGTATGEKAGTVITLTYGGGQIRFYENIDYVVSYDSCGGSAVSAQTVRNGKKATRPTNPSRSGYIFVGWYTDNDTFKSAYDFSTVVTGNVTLYAYWAAWANQAEFTVNFDLNYEGAPAYESKNTIGGKIYGAPEPTREGYEFKGWWVSMTMEKTDSGEPVLSYKLKDDTVLKESTTVYALWQAAAAVGEKLPSPIVDVTAAGLGWETVNMSNGYAVTVTGPNNYAYSKVELTTSVDIDFASLPVGDYTIRVVARSSAGESYYSAPAVRVYRNKGLARVSLFEVSNDQVLVYNAVDGATGYKISIDCGDKSHTHHPENPKSVVIDNGENTTYDFGTCPMQEGGIVFTVTAEGEGYMSSVATFTYDRKLGAVNASQMKYDQATETVSWNAVDNATGYAVSVNGGDPVTVESASFDIRTYAAGSVKVAVRPVAAGYNSPEAAEITVDKKTFATPSATRLDGGIFRWNTVADADKYVVEIGGKSFEVTGVTEIDLGKAKIDWKDGVDYAVTVKAQSGTSSSLASLPVAVYYNRMGDVEYADGIVSWSYVFGATAYEVRFNGGETVRIEDKTQTEITFDQEGDYKIEVRFIKGSSASQWVEKTVKVYALTFDLNGAPGLLDTQYYAVGDTLRLYNEANIGTEPVGHAFNGWYTTGGENGQRYDYTVYATEGNMTLYANWKVRSYVVTLDYNEMGTGPVETLTVTYGEPFSIAPPAEVFDGMFGFVGWYRSTDSTSLQYTNDDGVGLFDWNEPGNLTLYAHYSSVLAYEKQSDGTYWVKSGNITKGRTIITVPATYQGEGDAKPCLVSTIGSTAFDAFRDLVTVRIPSSILAIDLAAFQSCASLKNIEVYEVEGVNEPVYRSQDGVLYYNNDTTGGVDVWAYPRAKDEEIYEIPSFVTNIPIRAFWYSQFTEVIIPTNVISIMGTAFYKTDKLKTVTFKPDSSFVSGVNGTTLNPLTVAASAFGEAPNVTKMTLPARLADKEDGTFNTDMFHKLYSLTTVELDPDSKYKLTDNGMVYLPGSGGAGDKLVYCPSGTPGNVTISGNISTVGSHAFSGTRSILSITIPSSVSLIEKQGFAGYRIYPEGSTSSLTYADVQGTWARTITFAGNRIVPLVIGDIAFGYDYEKDAEGNIVKTYYTNCSYLEDLVFEEGCNVTEIGDWAFAGCHNLVNVTIPNSVEKIGTYAFYYCRAMVTFGFEETKEVDPDKTLSVGDGIFTDCVKLTSLTLPYYFNLEGNRGIFAGCANLQNVYVDENNPYLTSDNGVLFDKNIETIYFYPSARVGAYELPESVVTIGAGVFNGKEGLTSIKIHDKVTSIEMGAFKDCTELTVVEFVGDWTQKLTIGKEVFMGCKKLHTAILPDMLEEIPENLFNGCAKLEAVNIPATVTVIGKNSFKGCSAFKGELNSDGKWELFIPKSVTKLGYGAFWECTSITVVTFEDGRDANLDVLAVNDQEITGAPGTDTYSAAFYYCSNIEEVNLVEGITAIGGQMFYTCSKIASVNIPASVEYIGRQAFGKCYGITELTFTEREGAEPTPLTIETGQDSGYAAFNGIKVSEIVLPRGLKRIPHYAFYYIDTLEYVYIPNTVTNGSATSFKVSAPGGVSYLVTDYGEAIGKSAFGSCKNLSTVEFEEGGDLPFSLGEASFSNGALESIKLPARLTPFTYEGVTRHVIGNAFMGQTKLASVEIFEGGKYSDDNGILLEKNSDEKETYTVTYCPLGKSGKITLSYKITEIGNMAFASNAGITEISFEEAPEGVTASPLTIGGNSVDHTNTGSSLGSDAAFYCMGALTKITLPARLAKINEYAFLRCRNLDTVTFADGCAIEEICNNAFAECEKLVTVDFGADSKLKVIGASAFEKCLSLAEITLPDSLEEIRASAFEGLPKLVRVNITKDKNPDGSEATSKSSLSKIGNYAFSKSTIKSIYIPDGFDATGFGSNVFMGCSSLASVSIPGTISNVDGLFNGCFKLKDIEIRAVGDSAAISGEDGMLFTTDASGNKSLVYCSLGYSGVNGVVTVPDGVTAIASGAFAYNPYIEEVRIPTSVKTIGDQAFYMCRSLRKVSFYDTAYTVPQTMTVGVNAFGADAELTSVAFPRTLSSIGDYAFQYTSKLKSVTTGGETVDAVTFANGCVLSTIGKYAFYYSAIDSIKLPSMLQKIDDYAFRYSGLTSITIPNSVTEIGSPGKNNAAAASYVFADCKELETVVFAPGGAYDITLQNYTFNNCTALSSITLCTRIKSLGLYFCYNAAITEVEIPESVTIINQAAFRGCASLSKVTFAGTNCTTIDTGAFNECSSLTEITLPEGLTTLRAAFNKTGLTKLTIPGTVTTLVSATFTNTPIETIIFEDGNRPATFNLPSNLYKDLATLKNVTLPSDLVVINGSAFSGTGITSITIPAGVTKIGTNVFQYCSELTEVIFEEGATLSASSGWGSGTASGTPSYAYFFQGCEKLKKVVLPAGIKYLGVNLFNGLTALEEVTLRSGLLEISSYAFTGSGIKSITIPNTVTAIKFDAFRNCKNLTTVTFESGNTGVALVTESNVFHSTGITSLTLPARITALGNYAFAYCSSLKSVQFEEGSKLASIGTGTFRNTGFATVTLPETLTSIGSDAFRASKLTAIEIPKGVVSIGATAFVECTLLSEITVDAANANYSAENNILYNKDKTTLYAIAPVSVIGSFELADSVKEIGDYAFAYGVITSLTVGDGVTVGERAFSGCVNLATAVFGKDSSLGSRVFYGCNRLTRVTFGTDASLGNRMFENCVALESVTATDVAVVGLDMFVGCPDNVTFSGGEDAVPRYKGYDLVYDEDNEYWYVYVNSDFGTLFTGDIMVEHVMIGKDVTDIATSAFDGCSKLQTLVMEEGGEAEITIGQYAFRNCTSLRLLVLSKSVKLIRGSILVGSLSLEEVVTPFVGAVRAPNTTFESADGKATHMAYWYNNAMGVGGVPAPVKKVTVTDSEYMPYGSLPCEALEEVILPDNLLQIGQSLSATSGGLFQVKGINVKKIDFGKSLTALPNWLFTKCSALEEIHIPATVKTVNGTSVFSDAKALQKVYYGGTIDDWAKITFGAGTGGTPLGTGATLYIDGQPVSGEMVIPDGITAIGAYAFYNLKGITKITVPSSVKSYGNYAFANCTDLQTIIMGTPATAPTTGTYLFSGCTSLTSVTLPNNITTTGNYMFSGCTSLASVTLPNSLTTTGNYMFNGCTSLTSVELPASLKTVGTYMFTKCGFTEFTIPSTLATVNTGMFDGCKELTSITIPETVTRLEANALRNCPKLNNVVIPDSVSFVGNYMFQNDTALMSVKLPSSLTTLNTGLFQSCTALTQIELPAGLTSIGTNVFQASGITSIVLPEGITSLGNSAFLNCASLESITLPSTLTTIGNSVFSGCTSLESISVPVNVVSLGDSVFLNCRALTSVVFERDDAGNCALDTFGKEVFKNCEALSVVVIPSSLLKIGTDCFYGWTADQKVCMDGFGGPMTDWNFNWYSNTEATVVWDYQAEQEPDEPAPEEPEEQEQSL